MLVTSLGTKLTTGKNEQERDIASIGLKTVVAEVPTGIAKSIVKRVTPTLISGLSSTVTPHLPPQLGTFFSNLPDLHALTLVIVQEVDVVNASLEILNELLNKFGGLMAGDHARLRDTILPLLEDNRAGVKKRAIHCLGEAVHGFLSCTRQASRMEHCSVHMIKACRCTGSVLERQSAGCDRGADFGKAGVQVADSRRQPRLRASGGDPKVGYCMQSRFVHEVVQIKVSSTLQFPTVVCLQSEHRMATRRFP